MKNSKAMGMASSVKSHKREYVAPEFRIYGRVSELTQNGGASGSDGTGSSMTVTMGSDSRIKENIIRIGDHPGGFGLYLFDYRLAYREKWGQGRQFGVLADEVEKIMPEAISLHSDGYKLVDYAMLGIERPVH